MSHKHAITLGLVVVILGLASTLAVASAITLTCSQVNEVWLGTQRAGHMNRTTCIKAKGPDGQEMTVSLVDVRKGEKLVCEDNGDKITCPKTALSVYGNPSPWYAPHLRVLTPYGPSRPRLPHATCC